MDKDKFNMLIKICILVDGEMVGKKGKGFIGLARGLCFRGFGGRIRKYRGN